MEKKKTPFYVPVLWLITGVMWSVTFISNLIRGYTEIWVIVIQGLAAAISFIDAYVSYKRYKKDKENT